ncbi:MULTISPECIES: hypothetical protein [Gammaproteobacteria]|uniref:hypothetical protein n=1 Tax=Gammaproteobacteria TaxID=1236 RepID=UPI000DD07CDC|nr:MULTISPECIES: hypothetical protein [Gammaproteobacteria]RTE87193.1 hypothetical protein DQX04_02050 [Aliidiomarina sp. B3213]TCZ93019.1 hypothetical protein EYQ95_03255 [Lysobacter sp. N42]
MKLGGILGLVNQVEKSKFINVIDRMCTDVMADDKALASRVNKIDGQIKNASSVEITQLFNLVSSNFEREIKEQLALLGTQATLLTNILSRDGNCIARLSWIETLYDREWKLINKHAKELGTSLKSIDQTSDIDPRVKEYDIYYSCVREAYLNDQRNNRDAKITDDERGILNLLAKKLDIGSDEQAAIEHLINPIPKNGVQDALNNLRELGILFLSRKTQIVFVPDELVQILNNIQGKDVSTKHFQRILRTFSDPELSNILKAHDRKIRGVERKDKIDNILGMGVSLKQILSEDLHGDDSNLTNKKERLKTLIEDLNIDLDKIGTTLDDRIQLIVDSLNNSTDREFSALSASGYKEMYAQLETHFKDLPKLVRSNFEVEDNQEIDVETLRALSITPHDILYMLTNDEVKTIIESMGAKKRGNLRQNILEAFANANDKLIDNYEALAQRDVNLLREQNISITESEIGLKFEEVTKSIFEQLGLDIDEDVRRSINTAKDKADIIISLSEDDVIIGEAKTCKNGDFAKYSTTSRQVKAYVNRCESLGKRVAQVLIVAPSFSQDFVEAAEMDTEVNISLLEAGGLKKILDAYKARRNPKFSAKLFTKGGLLKANLIAKNI